MNAALIEKVARDAEVATRLRVLAGDYGLDPQDLVREFDEEADHKDCMDID